MWELFGELSAKIQGRNDGYCGKLFARYEKEKRPSLIALEGG